jgi:Domain of Unknown Function (DUF1543)
MKLFAIYIGGELKGANIELHDMRFVVAYSIADTYDELRRQWWGIPKSLHIDCWAEISEVDGYEVELRPEPFTGPEKLYYINLGGYDAGEFLEKHKNVFIVARTVSEAKRRAIKEATHWDIPHRDEMYEAEQAFSLSDVGEGKQLFVHLKESTGNQGLAFTCNYTPVRNAPNAGQ